MPPISVAGKHAIITGAGSGINLAFARLLLSRGCSVLIADLHLRPAAQALLSHHPGKAHFQPTDVTSWRHLTRLFDRARTIFPAVDIVVPGAGLFEPPTSGFWEAPRTETNPGSRSRDDAEGEPGSYKQLEVNLTHPIRLSQLAIGHWTEAKREGTLVHVASIAGYAAGIGSPIYMASKHGIVGFVRCLGGLRDRVGIRIGAVAPGGVKTPMWDEEKPGMADEDELLDPSEVAEAMLELCEKEEYGDGTILEVLRGKTRVVPLYNADPPSGQGLSISGWNQMQDDLFKRLETDGLKV